ncbi:MULTISPECIES: ParB N-terminal domain-containing protein [unclassified Brucella]|uniref:ParB/RepB/Spo0J family partition protein n=1 Tax=unclassified Brucella TaxID=2632610 RepID=UPI000972B021|nr:MULTISPECIES: ParB N-terminal domain-containing protein [unclassified Brucella]APX70290.1 chromosome partitioning protein ParB [Brucella sp. 09RB8471]MRN79852.1 chromosome partitioning protein ParB [Brucella sp. 10RB9210]
MTKHVVIGLPEVVKPVFQYIKLSDIDIPEDRARELDMDWAKALAFMIAAQGLINPITVRMVDGRPRLVTGLHRHAAFGLLEWETIQARISNAATDDEARLEEVMENLGRNELKVLDRCHHLFELKQVHERLYPETRNGGDRGNQHTGGRTQKFRSGKDSEEIFGFAASTAEKTGFSRRSIELAVKIWKDLSVASRQRCAGTWIADHQAGLKLLSEQSHTEQAKILDLLFSSPPKATSVQDAMSILANGSTKTATEKKVETVKNTLKALPEAVVASVVDERLAEMRQSIDVLSRFFAKLEDAELDKVVEQHEERIVASLKRRGVI